MAEMREKARERERSRVYTPQQQYPDDLLALLLLVKTQAHLGHWVTGSLTLPKQLTTPEALTPIRNVATKPPTTGTKPFSVDENFSSFQPTTTLLRSFFSSFTPSLPNIIHHG